MSDNWTCTASGFVASAIAFLLLQLAENSNGMVNAASAQYRVMEVRDVAGLSKSTTPSAGSSGAASDSTQSYPPSLLTHNESVEQLDTPRKHSSMSTHCDGKDEELVPCEGTNSKPVVHVVLA